MRPRKVRRGKSGRLDMKVPSQASRRRFAAARRFHTWWTAGALALVAVGCGSDDGDTSGESGSAGSGGEAGARGEGDGGPSATAGSGEAGMMSVAPGNACPGTPPPALTLTMIADGLVGPTHVAQAPGDPTRLYVTEQRGTLRVIENGVLSPDFVLDLRGAEMGAVNATEIAPGTY